MRGEIRNRERAQQIINYRDLRYPGRTYAGVITPTDFDGVLDFGGELFIYLEFKLKGAPFPHGQRLAMTNQCKAVTDSKRRAYALVCEHDTEPHEDIMAGDCSVRELWIDGEWREPTRPITCKEAVDILEASLL